MAGLRHWRSGQLRAASAASMASGSIRVSVVRGYVPSAYDAGAVDHERGRDEKVPASIGGVGGGSVWVERSLWKTSR